ncbi:hypothetical protein MMC25_001525 [Agyrium rufum]|nr:hypothetical protein [Agyrium rufum]
MSFQIYGTFKVESIPEIGRTQSVDCDPPNNATSTRTPGFPNAEPSFTARHHFYKRPYVETSSEEFRVRQSKPQPSDLPLTILSAVHQTAYNALMTYLGDSTHRFMDQRAVAADIAFHLNDILAAIYDWAAVTNNRQSCVLLL